MSFRCCLFFVLCLVVTPTFAAETDQFTLPPYELSEMGDALSEKIVKELRSAISSANGHASPSGEMVAQKLNDRVSPGLPQSFIEIWLNTSFFSASHPRYDIGMFSSIYAKVLALPGAFLFLAPTMKFYGVSMGTDKIGHFFQEGFHALEKYQSAKKRGASETQALAEAVKYSVDSEKTYFGLGLTGVWSNADLAANYAGLYFFRNLYEEVHIGDQKLAPMMSLKNGKWVLDETRVKHLLQPFMSDHFNEALTPSSYVSSLMRSQIESAVKERCRAWRNQNDALTRETIKSRMKKLETWFGENYGYDGKGVVSIADVCF